MCPIQLLFVRDSDCSVTRLHDSTKKSHSKTISDVEYISNIGQIITLTVPLFIVLANGCVMLKSILIRYQLTVHLNGRSTGNINKLRIRPSAVKLLDWIGVDVRYKQPNYDKFKS